MDSRIEVFVVGESKVGVLWRHGQMVSERSNAFAIAITGVVTGSLETCRVACLKDVGAGALALDVGRDEGPSVPLGLLLRLLVQLDAESRAYFVVAVRPSVGGAGVVQGLVAVGRTAVEELVVGEGEGVRGDRQVASGINREAITVAASTYETA